MKTEKMQNLNLKYTCPKCQNKTCKVGEMRATGGFWTKIFNIQNQKFSSVTCEKCSYTEFYKAPTSALSNIFDFFAN